jgi:hypothetical protein
MKSFAWMLVVLALLIPSIGSAQFKAQLEQEPSVADAMMRSDQSSLLFGWFDPSKFSMHHSLSMSYQTMGGQGVSLGMYTNSMAYQITDRLNARADVSLMYSPYNTFSAPGGKKNDLSKIFLSNAEVNYRPWDNFQIRLQYRQAPYGTYGYSPMMNSWFPEDGF